MEAEKGRGCQIHGDGKILNLGGEHTNGYTADILQNCTLETCIILLTNGHPKKFNLKGHKMI